MISALRSYTVAVLAILLGAVAGCSQVPVAATYPVSYQHKMQSVQHWEHLARAVTEQVREQIAVDPALAAKPIYVREQPRPTVFSDGFRSLLLTEMLNAGVAVSLSPQGAHELRFHTELLEHSERPRNRPAPGAITGVTAALLAPSLVAEDTFTAEQAGLTALGLAAAADLGLGATTLETDTEMVFTVSVWDGDVLRFREQEIFYVLPRDKGLYVGKTAVVEDDMEIAF